MGLTSLVWVCESVGVLVICVLVFAVFCIVVSFILFYLCIFIHNYVVCTSISTTATELKLNCSNNNNNNNNKFIYTCLSLTEILYFYTFVHTSI